MNLEDALELALDGKGVLFVGAGFSVGAMNLRNRSMQTAWGLSKLLAQACSLPGESVPLEDASEAYIEQFGKDALIHEIRQEFTATAVDRHHLSLAEVPWKSIYTTNYDNVLETACAELGRPLFPVTTANRIADVSNRDPLCVHLSGYVMSVTRQDLFSHFRLTDSSYLSADLADTAWAARFRDDIRLAEAVFFVGHSLADIDVRRLLFESRPLREKAFFITDTTDEVTRRRLQRFGTIVQENAARFADRMDKKRAVYEPREDEELRLFSIDEHPQKTARVAITDTDVLNLLLLGDWDSTKVSESLLFGKAYYVSRDSLSDQILDAVKSGERAVVISSELGNGKTLLLEGLRRRAVEEGYRVFDIREPTRDTDIELERVASLSGKILLTVDNYVDWLDEIRLFTQRSSDQARLVVSARTALHDVVVSDLCEAVGVESVLEFSADTLTSDEVVALSELLDEYGLWGKRAGAKWKDKTAFIRKECEGQFQAVLLKLLKSPDIRARFDALFTQAAATPEYADVIRTVLILTVLNVWPTIDALADLCGTDTIRKTGFRKHPVVTQLLDFRTHNVILRSSVVAQYLLRYVLDTATTVRVLTRLAQKACDLADVSERYKKLLVALIRFSSLQLVLPSQKRREAVIQFYEATKTLAFNRKNALFWLQYAIACLSVGELKRSEQYFDTAYALARSRGMNTFQIDNHYARFLLEKMIDDSVFDLPTFKKASDIIRRQIRNERMHYPYRVASKYRKLVEHFVHRLDKKSLEFIRDEALFISGRIDQLPEDRKRQKYVQTCQRDLKHVSRQLNAILTEAQGENPGT